MSTSELRDRVKKFIDKANEKELKMIYRMFEVEEEYDWFDDLPKSVQSDLDASIKQADEGKTIPHSKVRKSYSKWLQK